LVSLCIAEVVNATLGMFILVNTIFVTSLVLHYFLRPYKNHTSNIIEFVANAVVIYTYNCASYMDSNSNLIVVILVVLVNLCVLFPMVFFIMYDFFKSTNNNYTKLNSTTTNYNTSNRKSRSVVDDSISESEVSSVWEDKEESMPLLFGSIQRNK